MCKKTQAQLPSHLKVTCMKGDQQAEAREAAVKKAKQEVHQILVSGRVFSYGLLRQIQDDADPLSRFVQVKTTLIVSCLKCLNMESKLSTFSLKG